MSSITEGSRSSPELITAVGHPQFLSSVLRLFTFPDLKYPHSDFPSRSDRKNFLFLSFHRSGDCREVCVLRHLHEFHHLPDRSSWTINCVGRRQHQYLERGVLHASSSRRTSRRLFHRALPDNSCRLFCLRTGL